MRWFHDLPLKRKLTTLTLVISGTALLLACAAFAVYEQHRFRENNTRDFAILADMFDDNVASGLAFSDLDSMQQTLQSLGANPHIMAACVYNTEGQVLARYQRPNLTDFAFPAARESGQLSDGNRLDTFKDIILAGEKIGSVYIGSDLNELDERAWRYVLIVAALLLGCSLVTLLLSARLQTVVSRPIADLAQVAASVTAGDFSPRAIKRSNDEVGRLVEAFNKMIGTIQARNAELQLARDELEKRVGERTAELGLERARFKFLFDSVPIGISSFVPGEEQSTFLVNPAHERITGLTAEQVHGVTSFQAASHPDDYAKQRPLMDAFLRGEIDHYTVDKRYLHPDGAVVWASLTSRMLIDPISGKRQAVTTLTDISAMKAAQESAAREHARFKFIFNAVPIGLSWMVRGQLATRIANPANAAITGVPMEHCHELERYLAATHPEDRRKQDALHAALTAGDINHYALEKRYLHPDGSTHWAMLSVNLFRDETTGEEQEIRTTIDITERKRADEELRWKSAFLEALVETPLFGLRVVDPNGNKIFQNSRTVELWQIPAGVESDEDAKLHFLSQLAQPASFLGRMQHLAPHETTQDEINLRDGRVIDRYSAPVTGKDGKYYGRIFAYQDITERKRAELKLAETSALLETLLENSPDLIYFKDRASRFVRYSDAFASRFNFASSNALNGKTDFDLFTADHAQQAFDDEQAIMRTGESIIGQLERETYPDGRVTWALTTKVAWRDSSGAIVGTFGVSKDVTALKEAETRAAETHKQLLDISRQAGMAEVATGVLHNVGNVLNSVNVSSNLLADLVRHSKVDKVSKLAELIAEHKDALPAFFGSDPRGQKVPVFLQSLSKHLGQEQADVLKEIEALRKNIEHIKEIVAMQQNYAKVFGVSETVPVIDLVEDALRMNSGALQRHDVSLVRDYQAAPLATVDKHKVLQILVNLMRNAKYACDDSGRADKLMTVRVALAGERVKIQVIDNGVGIPSENLTRIFSHGFTTRKHGHGFGLHSCALAARELGGSLVAHSDGPGSGAIFTLELPHKTESRAA